MVQNPHQGRACGYGKGDYRSIDPVQTIIQINSCRFPFNNDWILCVTLWTVDNEGTPNKEVTKSRMVGNSIGESRYLYDLVGEPGSYFIFPTLFIRIPGLYKLQFRLIQVFSSDRKTLLPGTEVISTVFSDTFEVYPTKTFPGKSKPSVLMKVLAKQTHDVKSRSL
ncbi:velvet factor [Globomyces pollinis-pini]|nr:velvet factor [Globomyces pollinis-pini]